MVGQSHHCNYISVERVQTQYLHDVEPPE